MNLMRGAARNISNRVRGRRAIVSGGSRGIGFSIAWRLANAGMQVTLIGRDQEALEKAHSMLPQPRPGQGSSAATAAKPSQEGRETAAGAEQTFDFDVENDEETASDVESSIHDYVVGDVCDTGLWDSLFSRAAPPCHVLINAAGISQSSVLAVTSKNEMQRIIDVNLVAPMYASRTAMRSWLRNPRNAPLTERDRCIVNVASLLAVRGGAGSAAYAASKAGLIALTRALAEEGNPRNIRANVVVPGYITTSMTYDFPTERHNVLRSKIPSHRFGTSCEVADAVHFMVRNLYANNCVLNLDGGLSAVE